MFYPFKDLRKCNEEQSYRLQTLSTYLLHRKPKPLLVMTWQMAKLLFTLLYFFFLTYYTRRSAGKSQVSHNHMIGGHRVMSCDMCGKIVHRPCSSCLSSIQELNKNSIKFSLLTWTWSMVKSSQAKSLHLLSFLLFFSFFLSHNLSSCNYHGLPSSPM